MTAFLSPPEPILPVVSPEAPLFARERAQDGPVVDALVDRAFGPGRFAKAAERLREGNHVRLDLSVCAWDGDRLVGSARQWPVLIGGTPAIFLGPFAVEADWRRRGLGAALIERAAELAQAAGERLVLLVGDLAYFGPLGFERVPSGGAVLPGPVDPARVLWRPLRSGAAEGLSGPVRIRGTR